MHIRRNRFSKFLIVVEVKFDRACTRATAKRAVANCLGAGTKKNATVYYPTAINDGDPEEMIIRRVRV